MWQIALAMFVVGWALQFVGHAIEGKPPEFLKDWRFFFVGLRWWVAKMRGGPEAVTVAATIRASTRTILG